ncbi:MAG: tetratricopeptide repeat protein [Deltaproteobacteria bacterium]|nr:tetratricopeptide repeat protein [Deltaproteobacteria bacterium]
MFRPFLVCCAFLAPTAVLAAPLSGTFSSPLGPLKVAETADGTVTGAITDAKNVCSFPKGTVVLNGARLDESVAGSFKACRLISDTCFAGTLEGDTILLVTKGGALMSGTVHLDSKGCKTPVTGDAVTLRKAGAKPPPPPPPVADRGRAEALAKEAQPLLIAGEAEEARKKCQEAVKIDPGFSQGYTCIGISFFLRERYEETFEQYKLALEADPSNRDVYYNMACIYAVQSKVEEALEYLKLAVMNGYVDLKTLNNDSDLKNLHGNPTFEKLKVGEFE